MVAKNVLKVLHVASFQGNVGDRVSHSCFRDWFSSQVGAQVEWIEFEIRSVFRGENNFRASVANASTDADVIVFGGGGFFDLSRNDFWSGTSLDVDPGFLNSLDKPILFNSLGVDEGLGLGKNAQENFQSLQEFLISNPKVLVTIRNDGSAEVLQSRFGIPLGTIQEVPDPGFFSSALSLSDKPPISTPYVAISLAQDMPSTRFRTFGLERFVGQIAESIQALCSTTDLHFALVPHIYSDVGIAALLLESLPDQIRRERVVVAPLTTGSASENLAIEYYKHATLAWTMRFHASAIAISFDVPTIGLLSYPKVRHVFSQLPSFRGHGIEVSKLTLADELEELSKHLLQINDPNTLPRAVSPYMRACIDKRLHYGELIKKWAKNF